MLEDDEALIVVDFGEVSYIWVITKGQAEWKQLSISANDIAKEVATLRTALELDTLKSFDTDLAYQVYQQVLGPVEEFISNKTRLSFVLDRETDHCAAPLERDEQAARDHSWDRRYWRDRHRRYSCGSEGLPIGS